VIVESWWNDKTTGKGKPKHLDKFLFQSHFVHYKLGMECTEN